MDAIFLNTVRFDEALATQARAAARVEAGADGLILGFETHPVVTLGLRGRDHDLLRSRADFARAGVQVTNVDRGGRATLHNPGQLVIFPVVRVGPGGPRAWVERLITCTKDVTAALGHPLTWDEDAPGLYQADGAKVVAMGLRIRRGVSTHGLAINVRNDLSQFNLIHACGRSAAPLARLRTDLSLAEVFARWCARFGVDKVRTVLEV